MKKLSQSEVIESFIKVHGNKYDYSLVNYSGTHQPVKIICPKHGIFLQTPHKHKRGSVCPKCNVDKQKLTLEDFITKSNIIHNNKYDYSNVNYVNYHAKVEIICPIHGSFFQTPNNHLVGNGCMRCGKDKLASLFSFSNDVFIEKASKIHNNKYDYSNVNYINNKTHVEIICPNHGSFLQIPYTHLQGKGCRLCAVENGIKKLLKSGALGTSKEEQSIEKRLTELNIVFYKQYNKDPRYPWFCDFYIPEKDLFVEYNGFWVHQPELGWYENSNPEHQKVKMYVENNYEKWCPLAWWTYDVSKRKAANDNNLNYVALWNPKDIDDWFELGCPIGHDGNEMYSWRS